MAKIDVTKIEGYADMTPEEKLKALEGYDVPDPDYSGYVKKDVFDKTASELAAKKKELTEKMSEDEQKKAKEAEERQALEEKYNALLRENAVSKNKTKILGLGYDEKLADETAEAMADGDLEKVFKNQKKLRCGLTTGTCAAACAQAAMLRLLTGQVRSEVTVRLPESRKRVQVDVAAAKLHAEIADNRANRGHRCSGWDPRKVTRDRLISG